MATIVLVTAIVLVAVAVCRSNSNPSINLNHSIRHQYTGYIDERFVPILKDIEKYRTNELRGIGVTNGPARDY